MGAKRRSLDPNICLPPLLTRRAVVEMRSVGARRKLAGPAQDAPVSFERTVPGCRSQRQYRPRLPVPSVSFLTDSAGEAGQVLAR